MKHKTLEVGLDSQMSIVTSIMRPTCEPRIQMAPGLAQVVQVEAKTRDWLKQKDKLQECHIRCKVAKHKARLTRELKMKTATAKPSTRMFHYAS